MQVSEILKTKGSHVVKASAEAPVSSVAGELVERNIGSVVVTDGDGRVVGLLSERDIVRGLAEFGPEALGMRVRELMSQAVYCTPDELISDLMVTMTARRIRHLPVLVDGELAGIVSIGDVVKSRLAETELEAYVLREYITAR